jgi:hypothetical protein
MARHNSALPSGGEAAANGYRRRDRRRLWKEQPGLWNSAGLSLGPERVERPPAGALLQVGWKACTRLADWKQD